ncbi:MAG: alpha/beta fold hydrolase [Methyloligellaceae bacterium]
MPIAKSGDVRISYEIRNSESSEIPVFFISGLAGTRHGCLKQAAYFETKRPVILHDHRGTGESDKPPGVYSVPSMARDVIEIMDSSGIAKAHLVGMSTGGAIIQNLCLDFQERVQSAVLCCTWPRTDSFFRRQFEARKEVILKLGPDFAARQASTTLYDPEYFALNYDQIVALENFAIENSPPAQILAERIDAIVAHDLWQLLPQINRPVLVSCAKNDVVTPPYFSKQLAKLIPNAQLEIFEKGGHFFFISEAEEFNAKVDDFLCEWDRV